RGGEPLATLVLGAGGMRARPIGTPRRASTLSAAADPFGPDAPRRRSAHQPVAVGAADGLALSETGEPERREVRVSGRALRCERPPPRRPASPSCDPRPATA